MSDGCLCSLLQRIRSKPFVKVRIGDSYKIEINKKINPIELKEMLADIDEVVRAHLTPPVSGGSPVHRN